MNPCCLIVSFIIPLQLLVQFGTILAVPVVVVPVVSFPLGKIPTTTVTTATRTQQLQSQSEAQSQKQIQCFRPKKPFIWVLLSLVQDSIQTVASIVHTKTFQPPLQLLPGFLQPELAHAITYPTTSTTANTCRIIPNPIVTPTTKRFQWDAYVNRNTGKAQSREISSLQLLYHDNQQQRNNQNNNNYRNHHFPNTNSRATPTYYSQRFRDLFYSYPSWLCRFSVSLGLIQHQLLLNDTVDDTDDAIATATNTKHKKYSKNDHHGSPCRIHLRCLGIDVLVLGPSHTRIWKKKIHNQLQQVQITTVSIPIWGGVLTQPYPQQLQDSKQHNNYGTLLFHLQQNMDANNNACIVTEIENYQPSMCGPPVVNLFRAGLYRHTQSVMHAYIMWRFHRYLLTSY